MNYGGSPIGSITEGIHVDAFKFARYLHSRQDEGKIALKFSRDFFSKQLSQQIIRIFVQLLSMAGREPPETYTAKIVRATEIAAMMAVGPEDPRDQSTLLAIISTLPSASSRFHGFIVPTWQTGGASWTEADEYWSMVMTHAKYLQVYSCKTSQSKH